MKKPYFRNRKRALLAASILLLAARQAPGQEFQQYLSFDQRPVFEGLGMGLDAMRLTDLEEFRRDIPKGEFEFFDPDTRCQESICNGTQAGPVTICPSKNGCSPEQNAAFELNRSLADSVEKSETRGLPSFRSVVAILDQGGNVHCTGTLISSDTVLTAAHCLCDPDTGSRADLDKIFVGNDVRSDKADNVLYDIRDYELDDAVYDPAICDPSARREYIPDIAVIKFDGRVTDDYYARNLYPDSMDMNAGFPPTVVGFGRTENEATGRVKVFGTFEGNMRISAPEDARRDYKEIRIENPETKVAVCNNDSGGPLFRGGFQIAVTKSRIQGDDNSVCYPGGVFTVLTDEVVQWINERIAS